MIRAIVFDMDGVLVDSELLHLRALKITFAVMGVVLTEAACRQNMGRSTRDFLKTIIGDHGLEVSLDSVYIDHKRRLLQLYRNHVKPMEGATDLISMCQRAGIKLALASSSDKELIDVVLSKFSWQSIFKVVVSGEDVEKPKPHPAIFVKSADMLGFHPSECLAIEDSSAGVQSALAAGMICVGFKSPHSPYQDFRGADLILDDLSELNIEHWVVDSGKRDEQVKE